MVKPESDAVSSAVARLYNTYPFPPEPLLDEPPPGYNWRWNWVAAHSFCTGRRPPDEAVRILDAGCGTGVGTEYLVHLNPHAEVVGIDLSEGALSVARERCQRSGADRVEFQNVSIYDAATVPGTFDLINCVGVLHHMADPIRGIQALAQKLAPGGFLHVFVYAEIGRWEISLMQEAIALLQGDKRGDYTDGVRVGRKIFECLPENNRLRKRDRDRWALENHRDANFADMYVHPQEIDYNINTLFELIEASGLEFIGFSNPDYWSVERLLGQSPELMERVQSLGGKNPAHSLSDRRLYRLIELLDPEITHYEFFLGRPPIHRTDWSDDDELLHAIPERHPCMNGWPGRSIFNADYNVITLSDDESAFLDASVESGELGKVVEGDRPTVQSILKSVPLSLENVRKLFDQRLIVLNPCHSSAPKA
ncbi:MAG: class I SAM-dependent methyltransferase [Leptolyngbyaceae bacterium]|nr:class I SAM-dependent methyltransferase [Leptolyngbyaceae bacterium]